MSKRVIVYSVIVIASAIAIYLFAEGRSRPVPVAASLKADASRQAPVSCGRIISLSPSVTELLFALGLGDSVAGVTRYCDFPAQAKQKAKVGGYLDPNFEAITRLKADLVIGLTDHAGLKPNFSRLGIPIITVDHRSVQGILASITAIGAACNRQKEALQLSTDLEKRMAAVQKSVAGLDTPSVLISVGRNAQAGALGEIFISGNDGYYSSLIALAGGKNAYTGTTVSMPSFSGEGVMRLDPAVIIDIVTGALKNAQEREKIIRQWKAAGNTRAARTGRIYVFDDDFAVRPGPRFILLLEKLARAIHPEAVQEQVP